MSSRFEPPAGAPSAPAVPYTYQPYPKWLYHHELGTCVVQTAEQHDALSGLWQKSPDAATAAYERMQDAISVAAAERAYRDQSMRCGRPGGSPGARARIRRACLDSAGAAGAVASKEGRMSSTPNNSARESTGDRPAMTPRAVGAADVTGDRRRDRRDRGASRGAPAGAGVSAVPEGGVPGRAGGDAAAGRAGADGGGAGAGRCRSC